MEWECIYLCFISQDEFYQRNHFRIESIGFFLVLSGGCLFLHTFENSIRNSSEELIALFKNTKRYGDRVGG